MHRQGRGRVHVYISSTRPRAYMLGVHAYWALGLMHAQPRAYISGIYDAPCQVRMHIKRLSNSLGMYLRHVS